MEFINSIINNIKGRDIEAYSKAQKRQDNLLKPKGSLGILETISIKLAGITGKVNNSTNGRILYLFGADNGIYEEGVAATPQYFTKKLMISYADDIGTAITTICKSCQTDLKLVDMGIIDGVYHTKVDDRNLMDKGTNNFLKEKAIPKDILINAIKVGISYAKEAKEHGYHIIGNGEVGMANTTTATACIMASLGTDDISLVGRGAGLTDEAYKVKQEVIKKGLDKYNLYNKNSFEILECVGGLDIAAMVGLYLGAAYYRLPIVIDGLISVAAALLAYKIKPEVKDFMFASHKSEEPAYEKAICELGLEPILYLKMRLGEGSGTPIAMQIIHNAADIMSMMSTFDEENYEKDYRDDIKM